MRLFVLPIVFLAACSSTSSPSSPSTTANEDASATETGSSALPEGAPCPNKAAECAPLADGRSARCQCVEGSRPEVCAAQLPVGAKCPSGGAYSLDCSEGLRCVGNVCITPGDLGETCKLTEQCKEGLACTSGKCAAGHALGEGCDRLSDNCALPNHCDSVSFKCVPPGAVGEACNSYVAHRACVEGAACVSKKCVQLLDDGATCTTDGECLSGFCRKKDGALVCYPKSSITTTCGGI